MLRMSRARITAVTLCQQLGGGCRDFAGISSRDTVDPRLWFALLVSMTTDGPS